MGLFRSMAILFLVLGLSLSPNLGHSACPADFYRLSASAERFGTHETSAVFRARNPSNAKELAEANLEILRRIARGESTEKAAEIFSGRHQVDMLQPLTRKNRQTLERLGFRTHAFVSGLADSDKGKTAAYKALLTDESPKSNLLLDTLRGHSRSGNEKSVSALSELFREAGLEGRLLNPNLTNEELRAIFRHHPMLQNFLHELPGISDSILAHEAGVISTQEFKAQVAANLFHNGPGKGFWNFFTTVLVPLDLSKSADPKAKTFFRGTVFQGPMNQDVVAPVYRLPYSFEGIFHTVLDRLSQGTRGGIMKIAYELPPGMHGVAVFNDMLFNNPKGTIEQLLELKNHIRTAPVTAPQRELLLSVAGKAEKRVGALQDFLARRVKVEGEGEGRVLTLRSSDGLTHTFRASDPDPGLKERLSALVRQLLKEEEAKNGAPLKFEL